MGKKQGRKNKKIMRKMEGIKFLGRGLQPDQDKYTRDLAIKIFSKIQINSPFMHSKSCRAFFSKIKSLQLCPAVSYLIFN